MNLFKEILVDFILVIHSGYVGYVVFGQLAIVIGWALGWRWIRNPWFRVSHLVMISIVAFEAVIGYQCPLTVWERELRQDLGQIAVDPEPDDVEDVSFMARILRKFMFPDRYWVPYMNPGYYTFAGLVFATLILVPPRFRRGAARFAGRLPTPGPPTASLSATAVAPGAPAATPPK